MFQVKLRAPSLVLAFVTALAFTASASAELADSEFPSKSLLLFLAEFDALSDEDFELVVEKGLNDVEEAVYDEGAVLDGQTKAPQDGAEGKRNDDND